ncbi:MAG: ABC-2 transporter permease [Oscillospiraceae bacterium]
MLKGLILKDLYSIRFNLVMALLISLFPNMILTFAGGGMFVGSPDYIKVVSVIPYGMLNYLAITTFSSFVLNTLDSDKDCGWAKLVRSMPVSGGEIIGAKLISTYIVIGILTLVSLAFNSLGIILFGMDVELMIVLPICMGLLQVITLSPTFMLANRIGTKYTTVIYLTMVVLIACVTVVVMVTGLCGDVSATFLRITFYIGLPIIATAVAALSYSVGKKQNESDL